MEKCNEKRGKLLCYILIGICIFNEHCVFAGTDIENYSSEALKKVDTLYDWGEPFLNILKNKDAFSYRMIADYYKHHKFVNSLTNMAAFILKESI